MRTLPAVSQMETAGGGTKVRSVLIFLDFQSVAGGPEFPSELERRCILYPWQKKYFLTIFK